MMMATNGDEIDCSKPRRSYLITYSQAELSKFPTRESFAAAVCDVFTSEEVNLDRNTGHVVSRIMRITVYTIIWH